MTHESRVTVASRWDDEYRAGRYADHDPTDFIDAVGAAARERRPANEVGLYIGCGNGRNYVPLVERYKLDLIGIDVSSVAIDQLRQRMPDRADRLIHGDLEALPPQARFGTVIGIQVFQHGSEAEAHAHIRAAIQRLLPGGLFCLRVNAVGTEILHRHEIIGSNIQGGFTVRYDDGPKAGLDVHFFSQAEINTLTADLTPVSPLRTCRTKRSAPAHGHWEQWEGIWSRDNGRA